MAALFASGHIVDLIVAVIALEVLAVAVYRVHSGRGPTVGALLLNLGAGFCLLLALRAALTGAQWQWIALALGASFLAHLVDVSQRWRVGDAGRTHATRLLLSTKRQKSLSLSRRSP